MTTAITRELGVFEPTVRKCRSLEGLSQGPGPSCDLRFLYLKGLNDKIDS